MHIQFDVLCLITEPSAESVSVAREYLSMAREHAIEDRVMVVANQIENADDEGYLQAQGLCPVASIPFVHEMRRVVRERGRLDLEALPELAEAVRHLAHLLQRVSPMNREWRHEKLIELHRIQAEKKHHSASRDELLAQIG